ncbi:MAG: phospholipase D-like domain-containing protein, partial [Gemmatimonadota bacterium]
MISEPIESTAPPGHALDRASGSRPVPGNAVRLLTDGPEIFPEALAAIEQAQAWIHFDNYIFRPDRIGREFADALIARAQAGVRVRVLTDWLGSAGTPRDFWDRLRRAGVEVRQFNPLRLLDLGANLTRNHRKMIVVDGR